MSKQTSLPIAVQLYTLRHLEQPLDVTLGQVAAAGYAGVETIRDHGLSAAEMKDLLAKHNLKAICTHVPLAAAEDELDALIAFNQAIGNDCICVPALPQEERNRDAKGWLEMGRRLGAIGKRCAGEGMRFLYHNHAWEMVEMDGKLAIDWLFEGASPEHLLWEPDIAWVVRGNVDPLALLQRHAGRCPRIHVKDVAAAGQNEDQMGFADVGYGTLDWSALLPAAKAAGGEWYIVEHDLPKDPVQTVNRSCEFLQKALAPLYA
ncbi:MAG: sugar phosphate isomerase/epimerase [Chloroflexota bacterium]|nr:sugar phosphate isomerase/epimerase [Chloroflexota bacterium]